MLKRLFLSVPVGLAGFLLFFCMLCYLLVSGERTVHCSGDGRSWRCELTAQGWSGPVEGMQGRKMVDPQVVGVGLGGSGTYRVIAIGEEGSWMAFPKRWTRSAALADRSIVQKFATRPVGSFELSYPPVQSFRLLVSILGGLALCLVLEAFFHLVGLSNWGLAPARDHRRSKVISAGRATSVARSAISVDARRTSR